MTTYSKLSPYYHTPLNGSYLDILSLRNLTGETDDVRYEITSQYEYRPDLLAYDLYGSSRLWWVFAQRNADVIFDPIYDLVSFTENPFSKSFDNYLKNFEKQMEKR